MRANETIEKLPPCRLNDQSVCPTPASADKHPSNRATYAPKEAPNRPSPMSFPRRREPIFRHHTGITKKRMEKAWIPAFAGMTLRQGVRPKKGERLDRSERVGAFRGGSADCLTDPGIVCFPAARRADRIPLPCYPSRKTQAPAPCTQRGSITRPEKEFRRTRPETPRHAAALFPIQNAPIQTAPARNAPSRSHPAPHPLFSSPA
jgi:hypothetical protein